MGKQRLPLPDLIMMLMVEDGHSIGAKAQNGCQTFILHIYSNLFPYHCRAPISFSISVLDGEPQSLTYRFPTHSAPTTYHTSSASLTKFASQRLFRF
jgi:hypothetical protein